VDLKKSVIDCPQSSSTLTLDRLAEPASSATAGSSNTINLGYSNKFAPTASDITNNSGALQIVRKPNGGMVPQNLSGLSGYYIGQEALGDGTNTVGSGLWCTWDGSA